MSLINLFSNYKVTGQIPETKSNIYIIEKKRRRGRKNKKLVVKEIDNEILDNEYSIHLNIKHKNILKCLYGFINEEASKSSLVLEYCDTNLLDYSNSMKILAMQENIDDPYFELDYKNIMYKICRAVRYLHHRNIVHLDIKLENIFMKLNHKKGLYEPKLGDFGASVDMNQQIGYSNNTNYRTKKNHRKNSKILISEYVSTNLYSSPQFSPRSLTNPYKSDVWSLGITLHILNTGSLPFKAKIKEEDTVKIVKMDETIEDDQLYDLLSNMLDPCEETRYDINQVINHPYFDNVRKIKKNKNNNPERCLSTGNLLFLMNSPRDKIQKQPSIYGFLDKDNNNDSH